jgi:hypothetical protein
MNDKTKTALKPSAFVGLVVVVGHLVVSFPVLIEGTKYAGIHGGPAGAFWMILEFPILRLVFAIRPLSALCDRLSSLDFFLAYTGFASIVWFLCGFVISFVVKRFLMKGSKRSPEPPSG